MLRHSAVLLLLCGSLLWTRFTSNAAPYRPPAVQKQTRLEDIIGLFICGGTQDNYTTHKTTLNEFEIESFSHRASYQVWIDHGERCVFKNGQTMLGNLTWSTSAKGENNCNTSVPLGELNGGIQRYLRAHPTWTGRQCIFALHGSWTGYIAFSTEGGEYSAIDHNCDGFLSPTCILSGRNDCQGLYC